MERAYIRIEATDDTKKSLSTVKLPCVLMHFSLDRKACFRGPCSYAAVLSAKEAEETGHDTVTRAPKGIVETGWVNHSQCCKARPISARTCPAGRSIPGKTNWGGPSPQTGRRTEKRCRGHEHSIDV
jgi:hypothetical protein